MISLGAAFVLGLTGSLHCAGMCSPLMWHLLGKNRSFTPQLFYQSGRIFVYALLGLIGGLLGTRLLETGILNYLIIGIGIIMLFSLFTPKKWLGQIPWQKPLVSLQKYLPRAKRFPHAFLFSLGMMNGLIPCGLIYGALAGALLTGTWQQSTLFMASFGLGTLPLLTGLISLSKSVSPFFSRHNRTLQTLAIACISLLLIFRGLNVQFEVNTSEGWIPKVTVCGIR